MQNIKEAPELAVLLDDKNRHLVYEHILHLSKPANAGNGGLFSMERLDGELMSFSETQLTTIIKKLLFNHLLQQWFYFVYDTEIDALLVKPVFVVKPESSSIDQLYEETIKFSVASINEYLQSRKPLDMEKVWQDFSSDLYSDRPEIRLFSDNFLGAVETSDFKIIPQSRIISHILIDIKEELIENKAIAEIPGYGLLTLRANEMLDLVNLSEKFYQDYILEYCAKDKVCQRELAVIQIDEDMYLQNSNNPQTFRFNVERARAIDSHKLQDMHLSPHERYPGRLSLLLLSVVAPFVEDEMKAKWEEQKKQEVQNIKDNLKRGGSTVSEYLYILDEKAKRKFSDFMWNAITKDPEILYVEWYLDKTVFHCFVYKSTDVIYELASLMQNLSRGDRWQALVLRKMIEVMDADKDILFQDKVFVKNYGNSLRQVYMDYFPFYVKLLLFLGLKIFQDMAFGMAKEKIEKEQGGAHKQFEDREKVEIEKEQEKNRLRKELLGRLKNKNLILRILEEFIYGDKHIPTVKEISDRVDDDIKERLPEIIKREGFQIIHKKKSRESTEYEDILLYPLDQDWKANARKLHKYINEIIEKDVNQLPLQELDTIYQVRNFLNQPRQVSTQKIPLENDPYKLLAKEIEKSKNGSGMYSS